MKGGSKSTLIPTQAPRERNRTSTESRILAAVSSVIARDGLEALGSRSVAREAGVDHMLINRYFGGLSGLLEAYAASSEHWPSVDVLTDSGSIAGLPLAQRSARILVNLAKAVQARPVLRQLLAAETSHQNELTAALGRRRIEVANEINERYMKDLQSAPAGIDGMSLLSMIAATIHYLAARTGHPDQGFNGLGIKKPDDMARLVDLIEFLCVICFPPPSTTPNGGETTQESSTVGASIKSAQNESDTLK